MNRAKVEIFASVKKLKISIIKIKVAKKKLNKGITESRLIRKKFLNCTKLISKIKAVREKLRLGITKIKAAKKKVLKLNKAA